MSHDSTTPQGHVGLTGSSDITIVVPLYACNIITYIPIPLRFAKALVVCMQAHCNDQNTLNRMGLEFIVHSGIYIIQITREIIKGQVVFPPHLTAFY